MSRSQGDGPDYSSVFAKCVISCWAGHRRMNAAEDGEKAKNWEAGPGGGGGQIQLPAREEVLLEMEAGGH